MVKSLSSVERDGLMPDEKFGDFRDLDVWKQCKEIRREVWNLTKKFLIYSKTMPVTMSHLLRQAPLSGWSGSK